MCLVPTVYAIDFCAGKIFLDNEQLTFHIMGWLSKIFKGSSHKVAEGRYDMNYGSNTDGNIASSSWVN